MAYRILSLAGGGIRGLFQVQYLRHISEKLPKPLGSNFDLIAGTSTGAIIAIAIALDIDLGRVFDLFRNEGPTIFRQRRFAMFRKGARYSAVPLRVALEGVLGTKTLGQCKTPVVIPTTVLNRFGHRSVTTFNEDDLVLLAVDVALASCAAPTYFAPIKPKGQDRVYVDGGLWANTPSLAAALLAYSRKNIPFRDMKVLTIGNGERPAGAFVAEYGALRPISPTMVGHVLEMVFRTQSAMANEAVGIIVGSARHRVVNTTLPCDIELDGVDEAIEMLPALAEAEAASTITEICSFLLDLDSETTHTPTDSSESPSGALSNDSLKGGEQMPIFGFGKKTIDSIITKLPREELLRRSRILIVDDERPDLIDDLKHARFFVDWVTDITASNMDLIEKPLYDLVLLDFGNVGKAFGPDEGLALLSLIKRINPAIVVLSYTSKFLGTQHADFYRLADGVLAKDAGIAESLERIEDALRKAHSLTNVWASILALCDIRAGSAEDQHLQDLFVRGVSNPARLQQLKTQIMRQPLPEESKKAAVTFLTKAIELGVKSIMSGG
jgi:uncharacterized protein